LIAEATHDADGPQRRCAATGRTLPKEALVRFVAGPDGHVAADVAGRLPGRGVWVAAERAAIARAAAKGLFARGLGAAARGGPDLPDRVEALLARRCQDLLGMARRAGQVAAGFDKARAMIAAGKAGLLVEAADGAADGREKLIRLAPGLPVVRLLTGEELARALGREHVVHVAVAEGPLADRIAAEAARLAGFRRPADPEDEVRGPLT